MKIAHVVSTFPPYRAGIGNSAYHISWKLAELGHDVTVFTVGKWREKKLDDNMPFRVVRMQPWLWYGNGAFLPQLLWRLSGYDVVHLHYPFFGGAEMMYLADRFSALNVIVHYHMDVVGEGAMKKLFAFHTKHVMPRILDTANKIVVTSIDYALQSVLHDRLERDRAKFAEIPLGVNPIIFKPRIKNKRLLEKHSLQNRQVILFVGGLDRAHYFKGINYLIKAFQLISSNDEYRLIIVGEGNLRASYESIATNFGLDKKVIFTGFVPDDLLPLYYNVADIYVLPSIDSSEAFGISLLEAMASGLPAVVSDLPGVRSVVQRDQTAVLVKPRQVDALAKQLVALLRDPHRRNHFGEAARARVLEKYTWELVGAAFDKLYREHRA